MTEKVLDFNSQKDHYQADACVVWCFDDRFYKLLKAFGKQEGLKRIDLVKLAGGAKGLASEGGVDQDFLVNQIGASIRLHGTKRAILMVHMDCGGYGGSRAFNNDHSAEFEHHAAERMDARVLSLPLLHSFLISKDIWKLIPVGARNQDDAVSLIDAIGFDVTKDSIGTKLTDNVFIPLG